MARVAFCFNYFSPFYAISMKKLCFLITTVALAAAIAHLIAAPCALAATKRKTQSPSGYYLPKAGFPVLTREAQGETAGNGGSSDALPLVNGLHLQEGMDRRGGTGTQAYDPGEPTVRWDTKKFPVKVWISQGQMLPALPLKVAEDARPTLVHQMLQDPATFGRFEDLPVAKGWRAAMCDIVAEGIEKWRPLDDEGVIKFGFVDRPQDADVLVFFAETFPDSTEAGGNRVGAHTTGRAYTAKQIQDFQQQGLARVPVIMEFNVNEDLPKMQAHAAHEFGHALGITAHSPYREDLMYLYNMVDSPSPADKSTLRALYRSQPQLWRY
jgi:hypothetical protein